MVRTRRLLCAALSALSLGESTHSTCAALIAKLLAARVSIHQPGLFIVEVCSTIARRTRDPALALDAARVVLGTPGLELHELDHRLAAVAADVAAKCALRGVDAVYVATAYDCDATLLTLDREVQERGNTMATIQTPAEWLSSNRV